MLYFRNSKEYIIQQNVPSPNAEQKLFLIDNILDAISQNLGATVRKQIVAEAPTGSGKTFTITHHTMIEIVKKFPDRKIIFFVGPSQETIDEPLDITKNLFNNKWLNEERVCVYDKDQFNHMIKGRLEPSGDINIFCLTAQYVYEKYKNFDYTDSNSINLLLPDVVINDEAHYGRGIPGPETTKEDTGITNNNLNPVWFKLNEQFLLSGAEVIHLTATPTESQKTNTITGTEKFTHLNSMPKNCISNKFYKMFSCDVRETLKKSLKEYYNQVEQIKNIQSAINEVTWEQIDKQIDKTMPAMIVSLGRENCTNGLQYDQVIDEIERFCEDNKYNLFISTSKIKALCDYEKKVVRMLERMSEGIEMVNSLEFINRPLIMVVVESGKMGINIPRLTTAGLCKIPANKHVHNNYSQFVARTCRLPFFNNHDTAIDFIKNLGVSDQQKENIISYYTMLNTSFIVLPNTELMIRVKEWYTQDTFTMIEGQQYMLDGVFANTKSRGSGYYLQYDPGTLNNKFRKPYCEACEGNACMKATIEYCKKIYGADNARDTEYLEAWQKTLQVDHKDGNRYNNHPDNIITICPNVHMLKTMRNEDYLNIYQE